MAEEIRELLENFRFSEEESRKMVLKNLSIEADKGNEAWAVGRLLTKERVNKEAMYRFFRSLVHKRKCQFFGTLRWNVFSEIQ